MEIELLKSIGSIIVDVCLCFVTANQRNDQLCHAVRLDLAGNYVVAVPVAVAVAVVVAAVTAVANVASSVSPAADEFEVVAADIEVFVVPDSVEAVVAPVVVLLAAAATEKVFAANLYLIVADVVLDVVDLTDDRLVEYRLVVMYHEVYLAVRASLLSNAKE